MKKFIVAALIVAVAIVIIIPKGEKKEAPPSEKPTENEVLTEFTNLYEIPRGSENTKAIANYLKNWAKENQIKVTVDHFNNVIMEKPASEGYENAPTTILQSNMDMKYITADTIAFDPQTQPIALINEEDKILRAQDINLGAKTSAGMATALYVMKTAESHGPLKAIFTANKEDAMQGAKNLDAKYLQGDYLINLNHDSDSTLCNSSAGFTAYQVSRQLSWQAPTNNHAYEVTIRNLKGGDSGEEIDQDHANALKVLGTLLAEAQSQGVVLELASLNGGIEDSTIPSDATAVIVLNDYDVKKFKTVFRSAVNDFKSDFGSSEHDAEIELNELSEEQLPDKVLSHDDCNSIISYLYSIINGVYSMSPDIKDFVESSSNIGTAYTYTGNFTSTVLVRSSSEEKNQEFTEAFNTLSRLCNMNYIITTTGPAWQINLNSTLTPAMTSVYKELFNKDMKLQPVHSSSECGWFLQKNPNLDVVSLGFNIENSNTPNEELKLNTLTRPAEAIIKFLTDSTVKPTPPPIRDSSAEKDSTSTAGLTAPAVHE